MRIIINGTPHQVDFLHCPGLNGHRSTFCYFDMVPTHLGWPRATGMAECSAKDTFRKATGRKVALARALKARGYHKAWRTVFWSAYFKQAGQ